MKIFILFIFLFSINFFCISADIKQDSDQFLRNLAFPAGGYNSGGNEPNGRYAINNWNTNSNKKEASKQNDNNDDHDHDHQRRILDVKKPSSFPFPRPVGPGNDLNGRTTGDNKAPNGQNDDQNRRILDLFRQRLNRG